MRGGLRIRTIWLSGLVLLSSERQRIRRHDHQQVQEPADGTQKHAEDEEQRQGPEFLVEQITAVGQERDGDRHRHARTQHPGPPVLWRDRH